MIIFVLTTNGFNHLFSLNYSGNHISQEYILLQYLRLKTFLITEKSILIRNHSLYKFDQKQSQWKQICVSKKKIFDNQTTKISFPIKIIYFDSNCKFYCSFK